MSDSASSSVLSAWANFYVIVGSSAAALTGLMFIVITLVAGMERSRRSPEGIDTYSTPTVVHLCVALFVSAIVSAPWPSLLPPGIMLGLTGLFGIVYAVLVVLRVRRLTEYRVQVEDRIWYMALPFVAYAMMVLSAGLLSTGPTNALFALASAVLLLIFIGIHNAWDIVTYLTIVNMDEPPSASPKEEAG